MAYDPTHPTQQERSGMFRLIPLGLLTTVVSALLFAFTDETRLAGLFLLASWCGIWVLVLYRFADDYLQSLRLEASRWCLIAIGTWFIGVALVHVLGGGDADAARFAIPAFVQQPQWTALLGAFAFQAAFCALYLRDSGE